MLFETIHKNSIEATLVSFADKLDAFGESLHEIYAGNTVFLQHKELPKGVNPVTTYVKVLQEFKEKYVQLNKLFEQKHPLLREPINMNVKQIAQSGTPHTSCSLFKRTGNPHYDEWKRITIARGGKEGIRQLTQQQEYLSN